jgi:hypothetical protein
MKTTTQSKGRLVEVMERVGFKDGTRLAWVTYRIGDGERRAVSIRELGSAVPVTSEPVERNPAEEAERNLADLPRFPIRIVLFRLRLDAGATVEDAYRMVADLTEEEAIEAERAWLKSPKKRHGA